MIVSEMPHNPLATDDEISSQTMIFNIIASQKSLIMVPIVLLYTSCGNIVCHTFFNKSNCRKHWRMIFNGFGPSSTIASVKSVKEKKNQKKKLVFKQKSQRERRMNRVYLPNSLRMSASCDR